MAWGILIAALSLFGMFVIMIAYAREVDGPAAGEGTVAEATEMKEAA